MNWNYNVDQADSRKLYTVSVKGENGELFVLHDAYVRYAAPFEKEWWYESSFRTTLSVEGKVYAMIEKIEQPANTHSFEYGESIIEPVGLDFERKGKIAGVSGNWILVEWSLSEVPEKILLHQIFARRLRKTKAESNA